MTTLDLAELCHEANRVYCHLIGDDSQPFWADAPDWQKGSAISGVQSHLTKPDLSQSASHELWLAEKERTGWKYGLVKDAEKKEHPCCVPYDQLPADQKAKDALFKGIVAACRPLVMGPFLHE